MLWLFGISISIYFLVILRFAIGWKRFRLFKEDRMEVKTLIGIGMLMLMAMVILLVNFG